MSLFVFHVRGLDFQCGSTTLRYVKARLSHATGGGGLLKRMFPCAIVHWTPFSLLRATQYGDKSSRSFIGYNATRPDIAEWHVSLMFYLGQARAGSRDVISMGAKRALITYNE